MYNFAITRNIFLICQHETLGKMVIGCIIIEFGKHNTKKEITEYIILQIEFLASHWRHKIFLKLLEKQFFISAKFTNPEDEFHNIQLHVSKL